MNFGTLDLIVLIAYLVLILGIGMSAGRAKTSKDFFLGNKNLPWYFIMFSIVATETSSLTFLNVPGISYKTNFAFLQIALGFLFGKIFVSIVILPLYYEQGYISVYQWIGDHFGKKAQRYASSSFLITRVLGDGIRLYATSIPLALILGTYFGSSMDVQELMIVSLIILSAITIVYTVYGGFRSVVFTDTAQFIIYLGGGIFSLFYIYYHLPGSLTLDSLFAKSLESNKISIWMGFQGDFLTSPYFFINGILAGTLITIGTHGVDQMFAQRLLACRSEKESRLALIGSGIAVFFQFFIFLCVGLLLFFYYNSSEYPQDKVFSMFITEKIPSPILGLLVAAILASAMSTLSSSINSLSLSYLVDWKHFERESQSLQLKDSKYLSLFWGIVLFFSSLLPLFLTSKFSEGLVDLGLKVSSFTLGPLIGVFLLGRFMKLERKIHGATLGFSMVASILTTIFFTYKFNPALTFVIPMGILSLYFFLFIGQFFEHKRQKV